MKRSKKILVLLAAGILLCLVTWGFLKAFLRAIPREPSPSRTTGETVYYAPLETDGQTVETAPPVTAPPRVLPQQTQTATEAPAETAPETAPAAASGTAAETAAPETAAEETVPQTTAQAVPGTAAASVSAAPSGERKKYDSVPNYYETDYPDIRFGSGSFADYGSGVTSVAMVATYLTGYEIGRAHV